MRLVHKTGLLLAVLSLAGFDAYLGSVSESKPATTWYCSALCQPDDPEHCQAEGGIGSSRDRAAAQRQAEQAARSRGAPCRLKSCDLSCEEKLD